MSIQLGAHVGVQNISIEDLRSSWRRLEEGGLDWLSLWDHLYEVPSQGGTRPQFESLTALAAMCTDTSRVRIGLLVGNVVFRNPAYLAKAATTLDHISGGRFELGLGAGWIAEEARAFGFDFPPLNVRMGMLEDALPMVKSLLTKERTSYHGKHYRAHDAANLPRPVRGHLPIWVGGTGKVRTPRLAALYADGWNAPYVSLATWSELNASVDRACEAVGRDPHELERSVNLGFYLSTDGTKTNEVKATLQQAMGDAAEEFIAGALIGTPEQALERILEYAEAGAQGVNVVLRAPLEDDAMDAFLEYVVPRVRTAFG